MTIPDGLFFHEATVDDFTYENDSIVLYLSDVADKEDHLFEIKIEYKDVNQLLIEGVPMEILNKPSWYGKLLELECSQTNATMLVVWSTFQPLQTVTLCYEILCSQILISQR